MDFLKSFDLELYNLYLAIQEDMGTHPLYAVSKAQLFVDKLHDKIPHASVAFIEKFEGELAWLLGLSGDVTLDDALIAHEMLYRMASWVILTFEASHEDIPIYTPPFQTQNRGLNEAEVLELIEKKVLITLCGIIKEMDTIMSVLDDVERAIGEYSAQEERIAALEAELSRLKNELPGFKGLLKSLPRTLDI